MLGSDKSRGYRLEMICADFLAGANLTDWDSDVLLRVLSRSFHFLPANQEQASNRVRLRLTRSRQRV